MGNDRGRVRVFLPVWWLLALWLPMAGHAQTHTPEDEYKDLIRVSQDIEPLGEHPFGAHIGLYNGSLSFQQTDVSLAGNGPLLQLARTFEIEGSDGFAGRPDKAFGDWDIALPRIETLTAEGWFYTPADGWQQADGWQVNSASNPNLRCANFAKPLSISTMPNVSGLLPWMPATWWHGYHLVVPGHGSQDLLANPAVDDAGVPAVTKDHWRISCINEATTDNGKPGDGFIAQAPDGTRYWFNELVYRWAPTLERPLYTPISKNRSPGQQGPAFLHNRELLARFLGLLTGSTPAHAAPDHDFLQRREAWMLVTKIEDRFGNTLTFSYDAAGQLTKIEADDGRTLTVQRVAGTHRIHTVKLQPASGAARVWTYAYDTQISGRPRLTAVTLPDGRQWQFDLIEFDRDATLETAFHSCINLGEPVDATWTGSITHPSGLTGQFAVHPVAHGRSDVPRSCLGMQYGNDDPGSYAVIPKAWYSYTIKSKTFRGAGIPVETWSYSYSPANASWADECTNGCASTVWTQVRNPDGSSIKYTFSNRFDYTESQLLQTDYYSGDGTGLLRTVVNDYAQPTGQAWPDTVGYNLQSRINSAQTEQRSPLYKREIHQDGDTYTWLAEAFNAYAQVTKTRRFNSIAGQQAVETQTSYRNDTNHWVLGLPTEIKNLTTGEVETHYTYNSLDLMTARQRFGHTVMHYTWNGAGQLASFTDANGHTTTLSSYQRGIPRTIGYPDGTHQHLTVDDLGQITAITDQANRVTHYQYDAAGRLARITYPTGGVNWYPKIFNYTYVTSSERGIPGGHWRRTTYQGDARHRTYYDALLRPILATTWITGKNGSQSSVRTTYNKRGQPIYVSRPFGGWPSLGSITGRGTTKTYDALGRVRSITRLTPELSGNATTHISYLSGARKRVTDPNGHVTTTSYQVFDTPSYKAPIKVQAPEGVVQSIARNLYGDPTRITQSGPNSLGGTISITKRLYYDSQHRLCLAKDTEAGSTVMRYDAAGNLIWSADGRTRTFTDCGSVPVASRTTRTYDAMNRLKTVSYPDGQGNTRTFYNALGQVTQATAYTATGPVTWTYAYDNRGHLTRETLHVDGYSKTLRYAYSGYGSLSALTYPSGYQVVYMPDALGRPTRSGGYVDSARYFPDGRLKSFDYRGGHASFLASEYPSGRLHNLTVGNGSTLYYSVDYQYDRNANITRMTDLTTSGERSQVLHYDGLNRLTEAQAPALYGTVHYVYDALNNLRKLTRNSVALTYGYNSNNHLKTVKHGSTVLHSLTYNSPGDVILRDGQSLDYSNGHRLLKIVGQSSYAYDAAGRRVKATVNGNTTYSAYNRAGKLIFQWQPGGSNTYYMYLGNKLVTKVRDGAIILLITDAQGTVVGEMTTGGSVTYKAAYRPYGEQAEGVPQAGPGYTGHVNDPVTGLVYMQQRYYDPALQRFISPDPVKPVPGNLFNFNRYAYANNNPIVNIDPDGRCVGAPKNKDAPCDPEPTEPPVPSTPPPPAPTQLPTVTVTAYAPALPGGGYIRPIETPALPRIPWVPLVRGVLGKIAVPVMLLWPTKMGYAPCEMNFTCGAMHNEAAQPDEKDLTKVKERDGNKVAQGAGYDDAHDAKKGRGGGGVDIYRDKTTGKNWLWNGVPGSEKEEL